MKINLFSRSIAIALVLTLVSFSVVLAHGEPIITVEPAVAAPGGQITITGADMEDGEVFMITLEGAAGVFELGEVTASLEGMEEEEAGFTAVFTLPTDLTPGSYLLRAATDEGETATADLTISDATPELINAQPMEASAEPLALDRSKSPFLIGSVIVLALLSAGLGVWLVRKRE